MMPIVTKERKVQVSQLDAVTGLYVRAESECQHWQHQSTKKERAGGITSFNKAQGKNLGNGL